MREERDTSWFKACFEQERKEITGITVRNGEINGENPGKTSREEGFPLRNARKVRNTSQDGNIPVCQELCSP